MANKCWQALTGGPSGIAIHDNLQPNQTHGIIVAVMPVLYWQLAVIARTLLAIDGTNRMWCCICMRIQADVEAEAACACKDSPPHAWVAAAG
jgi:hypothetical protein